jgi:hypothetical protein
MNSVVFQKDIDVRFPPLIFGVMSIAAAFCVLFFPETKGKPLPEDLDDFDAGPVLNFFVRRKCKADELHSRINENQISNNLLATENSDI